MSVQFSWIYILIYYQEVKDINLQVYKLKESLGSQIVKKEIFCRVYHASCSWISSRYFPWKACDQISYYDTYLGIKTARQDRISQFVDTLEKNGFINLIDTANANARFYWITENGLMEYNRWVRNFLAFFRDINNLDYDEEDNVKNNIIQNDIFV
jgi:hypothetical protein